LAKQKHHNHTSQAERWLDAWNAAALR